MDNILNKSGVGLAHLNCCSLLSRFEMFRTQVVSSGIDVFEVSESWLTGAIPDESVRLNGYNLNRLDRLWNDNGSTTPKRGGGLICYVKEKWQTSGTKFMHLYRSNRDIEMQWISLHTPSLRQIVIINAYRPSQGDYKVACKAINDSANAANLKPNVEIYLMGDFNINLNDRNSPATKELMYVTGAMGLLPKITASTRNSCRNGVLTSTCIDQIFTNSRLIAEAKTLDLNISDHLATYVRRKKNSQKEG